MLPCWISCDTSSSDIRVYDLRAVKSLPTIQSMQFQWFTHGAAGVQVFNDGFSRAPAPLKP